MAYRFNTVEKKASEVFKFCDGDDCKRYLWRHAWRTQKETIESVLFSYKISLSDDYETGDIFVVSESPNMDTARIDISKVFNQACENRTAIHHNLKSRLLQNEILDGLIQQFSDSELSIFKDKNGDGIWVVGVHQNVFDVIPKLENQADKIANVSSPKSTNEDRNGKRSSLEESFVNVRDPINVQLSQKEEAMMWLYNIFDLNCLKSPNAGVHIAKDRFHVQISVTDTETKNLIEKEIKDRISLMKYTVEFRKRSFSSSVFEFFIREEVHNFLKSKTSQAVWFEEAQNIIIVYCKNSTRAEESLEVLTKAIKEDSILVPSGYFKTDKAKKELLSLERDYSKKAVIKLSENCSTVNLLHTSDNYDIKTKIEKLFATRSVYMTKKYKISFKKQKRSMEGKYWINLLEAEQNASYGWIIKGEIQHVKLAYDEICKLRDSMVYEVKTFMIDQHFAAVEEAIKPIEYTCNCSILVTNNTKAVTTRDEQNLTDLRSHIPCRTWNTFGSVLTLYQCNMHQYPWMFKDCIVVEVHQTDQPVKKTGIRSGQQCMIASVYFPIWKDGGHKEKEQLKDELTCLMEMAKSYRGNSFTCLSFNLIDADKLNWGRNKYVKIILATIELCQPSMPMRFHEPCSNEFKKEVDIIDTWTTGTYNGGAMRQRIQIKVETGELVQQQCDVIVNSTSSNLDLDQGAVSKSILKRAGPKIQEDCKIWLKNRQKIEFAEVCITPGYGLSCNYVFHGALPYWKTRKDQMVDMFVENCLSLAETKQLKSIAFPALGTGNLGYSANVVAAKLFDTVEKYLLNNPNGSLEEVRFVIYQNDHETIKVFKSVESSRQKKGLIPHLGMDSVVTCPDIVTFSVSVVGENNKDVKNAFKEIEDNLRHKKIDKMEPDNLEHTTEIDNTLISEPGDQYIDRWDKNVQENENQLQENNSGGKDEMEKRTAKDGKTERDASMYKDKITDDEYRVEIRIIDDIKKIGDPQTHLFYMLSQCGVHHEEIAWNPSSPLQARVRRKTETEADELNSFLSKKRIYEVKKCRPEAVVNIRATLNSGMNIFVENEKCQKLLSSMSGVTLQKDTKTNVFTLLGDLTEISKARELLLDWKKQRNQENYNQIGVEPLTGTGESPQKRLSEDRSEGQRRNSGTSSNVLVSDTNTEWKKNVSKTDGVLQVKIENSDKRSTFEKHTSHTDESNIEGRNDHINTPFTDQAAHQPDTNATSNAKNKMHPNLEDENTEENIPTNLNPEFQKSSIFEDQFRKGVNAGSKEENLYPRQPKQGCSGEGEGAISKIPQDFPSPSDDSLMITTNEGIKVYVYQANLCSLKVNCIVNSSNSRMVHRHGLSKVISDQAGKTLEDECKKYIDIRRLLKEGDVVTTSAGNIWQYKSILHVNAPRWNSSLAEEDFSESLIEAVVVCLLEANKNKMKSIAIPALSSGSEEVPKVLCYSAYPQGVIRFSGQVGKKSTIKEIHFVDIDLDVVQHIQGAFIETIPEHDVARKKKQNIMPNIKEFFAKRKQAGKFYDSYDFLNKVVVLTCDGTLTKALKHPHVKDVSSKKWSHEETAVGVPETVCFNGKYRIEVLKKGGKEFQEKLARNTRTRKNPGEVIHSTGDKELGFGHVFLPIMPVFSKYAKEKNSSQQRYFFKMIKECCRNVLERANKQSVKHLAISVLGPEFYDYKEKWFLERCVGNMICGISDFALDRNPQTNDYMIVHIVTNGNDEMLKMFRESDLKATIRESVV